MCLLLVEPKPVLFITAGATSRGHSVLHLDVALKGYPDITACHANKTICSLIMCGMGKAHCDLAGLEAGCKIHAHPLTFHSDRWNGEGDGHS